MPLSFGDWTVEDEWTWRPREHNRNNNSKRSSTGSTRERDEKQASPLGRLAAIWESRK